MVGNADILWRYLEIQGGTQGADLAYSFYEFFAGGGMARSGLGLRWECLFANDIDPKKASTYKANWGEKELFVRDVAKIKTHDLPYEADMAWASFPCQDLSLAGAGAGLDGERSGTFWPFWKLMRKLRAEAKSPKLVVLENVYGAITSHAGKDFTAILAALAKADYSFGAVVIDAVHFVPQSRPRLFIIGVRSDVYLPVWISRSEPDPEWHPQALIAAYERLPKSVAKKWTWWNVPIPPARRLSFVDIIEDDPKGIKWHTPAETRYILGMMSDVNKAKVELAKKSKQKVVGGVYRRTRNGVQRAEVRFDDVAGCLRTPQGGSSRQTILVIENRKIRSRLLSPREAARLMGLPDSYKLPANYNAAYHIAGDGVVVPVVRHIARNILEPILAAHAMRARKAA